MLKIEGNKLIEVKYRYKCICGKMIKDGNEKKGLERMNKHLSKCKIMKFLKKMNKILPGVTMKEISKLLGNENVRSI